MPPRTEADETPTTLVRRIGEGGLTVVEILIGLVILVLVISMIVSMVSTMTRQSTRAFHTLSQTQDALMLIETIRLELGSLVLNPFADARDHDGNAFLLSKPNGTSIQFVMERLEKTKRNRYLVYYEAKNRTGPDAGQGLSLRKIVWKFNQDSVWYDKIAYPPGWPSGWIGPVVETQEGKYKSLSIQDMRWQYLTPEENEGRVFFRLKLVLKAAEGMRLLPFTTLIGVQTPDLPTTVSNCPCLFDPCFSKMPRNCACCSGGGKR